MPVDVPGDLFPRLEAALLVRQTILSSHDQGVVRLFNGFYEGCPGLVADLYARTLVLYGYDKDESAALALLDAAQTFYLANLPGVECVVQKVRYAREQKLRRGFVAYGQLPASSVVEHGITYCVDTCLHQDASFYPDTRNLRLWLKENCAGKTVLNLFAYTGSLGVAALAGGAHQVTQVDLKRKNLDIARQSARLNGFEEHRHLLEAADFFSKAAYYKRQGALFDVVILDAPFFSATAKGSVDLVNQNVRLVNKVRPLAADGGRLVVVNNALFLPGRDFFDHMLALGKDGYFNLLHIISIPQDITGFPETIVRTAPADPAPFNHPTKIMIMEVRRK